MITHFCDRCGQPISKGALRYVAHIKVYAAADEPLEITEEDLQRDHLAEIERLINEAAGMTEEELMRDVYVEFKFDICPHCQRIIIENPLPPMALP